MSTTTERPDTHSGQGVGDQRNLIGGEWREPSNGRRLSVINPADGTVIGTLPDTGADDVDDAVRRAAAAFAEGEGAWATLPVSERQRILGRIVEGLAARAEELGALEALDGGFTIRNAVGFHASGAPAFMQATLAQAPSDQPTGLPLTEVPTLAANYVRREPIGVVVAMPPSNGGFFLGLYKTIAALVTGNCVILKPSPLCALTCVELAKAIDADPEVPDGVFQLVLGDADAGAALSAHPRVDKISFTGSVATAERIMAAAAPNITKLTLELGGKGPVIVCDDADLDRTVDGIVWGILWQTGQACIAGSRVLVSAARKHELIARLRERMERLVIGDPMDPATDLGPVASEAARDRIESFVSGAVAAGATVAYGGERPDIASGFWAAPTILDDVSNDMDVARNEIFGPVMAVITYEDVDDAVRIANDTEYGLGATVWSASYPAAMAIAKRLRAGTVWINDHHMMFPTAPFGGYKKSGMGREFGSWGLEAFTEIKHIHVDLAQGEGNPAWGILLGAS